MMSSEEDTVAEAAATMQERNLKVKGKRTRQRVDAGEPRSANAANCASSTTASLGSALRSPSQGTAAVQQLHHHALHQNGYTGSGVKMLDELLLSSRAKEDMVVVESPRADPRVNGTPPELSMSPLYGQNVDSPPAVTDSAHLLRDILQGRKHTVASSHCGEDGSASPPGATQQQTSELRGDISGQDVMMERSSLSPAGSDVEDDDETEDGLIRSGSSNGSVCGDHRTSSASSGAGVQMVNGVSGHSQQSSAAPSANMEVKRARVENIVSNMLLGPSQRSSATGGSGGQDPMTTPVNGCKKRKLYQPQQHEVSRLSNGSVVTGEDDVEEDVGDDELGEDDEEDDEEMEDEVLPPPTKQRRVEREALKQQLKMMQQQLSVMQQRYDALFDGHSSDSESAMGGMDLRQQDDRLSPADLLMDEPEKTKSPQPSLKDVSVQEPSSPRDEVRHSSNKQHANNRDIEPSHFLDEARRLVSEQERAAMEREAYLRRQASSELRQSCIVRPPLTPNNPHLPPPSQHHALHASSGVILSDMDRLVAALKTEIAATLTQVIDAIVSRYVPPSRRVVESQTESTKDLSLLAQMLDRKSPRTKVIDRGRVNGHPPSGHHNSSNQRSSPFPNDPPKPPLFYPPVSAFQSKAAATAAALFCGGPNAVPQPPLSLLAPPPAQDSSSQQPRQGTPPAPPVTQFTGGSRPVPSQGGGELPEQTEAMSLVVTPKKKRHKVTDTRLTPRPGCRSDSDGSPKYGESPAGAAYPHHPAPPPLVPVSLPTTVAIPNPSLHHSDVFSAFQFEHPRLGHYQEPPDDDAPLMHSTPVHPSLMMAHGSPDSLHYLHPTKQENGAGDGSDNGDSQSYDSGMAMTSTLTPMHLRKAKLMFFYVRYPSSAILKMYFPDIKFNKNNTAQLVKWFSNFREFYYIQMEKYARQSVSEGIKNIEEIRVGMDSELLRVLNLHYNRNNHIEVPENFRYVVEQTLREFFRAIMAGKDQEQSWKKAIYKVIARLDDNVPEYFKSPNFLEQLE